MLQDPLHRDLLGSFELSADTVPEHGRDQRSPKPRQRRGPTRRHRSHCRRSHSFGGVLHLSDKGSLRRRRGRTGQAARSGAQLLITNVGRTRLTLRLLPRILWMPVWVDAHLWVNRVADMQNPNSASHPLPPTPSPTVHTAVEIYLGFMERQW